MTVLTEEDAELLRIDKFIFHVVHHGQDQPILFAETPIGDFEPFFLARVRDTLKGNRFDFLEGSATRASLKAVADDTGQFVDVSTTLARTFHQNIGSDKRIKPGVLIFMSLGVGDRQLFSLIKYDHEQVLSYDVVGDVRAVLREITNSFTKSTEALQKSALITLTEEGGELVVIDRKVQADISEFFKGFLAVKRAYTGAELTGALEKVVKETVKAHRTQLPPDIVSKVTQRLYDAVQNRDTFEEQQFFGEFFGAYGDEKVRKTFSRLLKQNNLDGEVFEYQREVITRPRPQRYHTAEGVDINISEQAQATVAIAHRPDGGATITIQTAKLYEK
jgi:hypothetical protein